jgi:hypothetical protein
VKTEELKSLSVVLRELGSSYEETLDAMKEVAKNSHLAGRLWKNGEKKTLVKMGLALIALPDPIVSDIIGALLISAGIVQAKIKSSTLHVEDVYNTFPKLIKELHESKRELF